MPKIYRRNMNKWSEKSRIQRETIHPELKLLADVMLQIHDCSLLQGFRGEEEQNNAYYMNNSKLKWPESKHNKTPSLAMDLAPYIKGQSYWDREQVLFFAGMVVAVADVLYEQGNMKYRIRWGGDWDSDNNFKEHSFFDGIHFELVI
jgi:peptidoglycan L-alanyl-D-glutamate endopeptidase CwlK